MNAIQRIFNRPRVLLPVVHPVTEIDATNSIDLAVEAGCSGLFLINQGMSSVGVLSLARRTKEEHPHLWVGLNLLGHPLEEAYAEIAGLDGMWVDRTEVTVTGIHGLPEHSLKREGHPTLFGGVAFKYQAPVADEYLERTAEIASMYVDVVTTSGPGTGKPASVEKIEKMKRGVGAKALGLASGVDLDNVSMYLPYVSAFLVGTGIEESFGILDLRKVQELRVAIEES